MGKRILPESTPMIALAGVAKKFGHRWALHPVGLTVPKGAVFGLLGHNGAGKSTLIGLLLGQVFPTAGDVMVNGYDVFRERGQALARVGAIFETPAFYHYLSGLTNLRMFCELTGTVDVHRLAEVIRLVKLEGVIDQPVATYSHGMRQRLALAQALVPDPELLILDEPAEGLDPEGVYEMRELIRRLNRDWGLTILLASHVLGEVEQLASQVAVLRQGRLLFSGAWQARAATERWIRFKTDRQADAEAGLLASGLIVQVTAARSRLAEGHAIEDIGTWLVGHDYRLSLLAPVEYTLEDFYLEQQQAEPT